MISDDPNRIAVLAVGVERYPWADMDLRGPARQAFDVAVWGARVGIPAGNIVLATSWVDEDEDRPARPESQEPRWLDLGTNAEDITAAVGHLGARDIDTLVIYWCGHGFVHPREGERSLLVTNRLPGEIAQCISVEQLGANFQRRFERRSQPVDQVRIIDACAIEAVPEQTPTAAFLHLPAMPTGVGAATYQLSSAEVGSWSQFDTRTQRSHFSRLTQCWLDRQDALPLDVGGLFAFVVYEIHRLIATEGATCRLPRVDAGGTGVDFAFLRTPLPIQALNRQRADLEGPFARGIPSFVPRVRALTRITTWLSGAERRGPLLVSGASGAGKTALLGVVANLGMGAADIVDSADWASTHVPPRGSVSAAIYAEGHDARQILTRIALAAGLDGQQVAAIADDATGGIDPVAQIAADLRRAGREIVVLIDALERAVEPDQLARGVLKRLIEECGDVVHLIVGRAGPWEEWADDLERLTLDGEYADPLAVGSRVASLLRAPEASQVSPWDAMDGSDFRRAVDEIVAIAAQSFVLAEELAVFQRALAPPVTVDGEWVAGLPRSIREGMEARLDELDLDGGAQRALALLMPLVYARGDGMPWGVWCDLANRFAPVHVFDEVRDRALRDALARYAVADPSGSRYRLRHDSIAEALSPARVQAEDELLIVGALRAGCHSSNGRLDWTAAPYAVAHVIDHAMAARSMDSTKLDQLLVDPGLVLLAEPAQLLTAFGESANNDVRQVAMVYRNALRWLREGTSLGDRAAQFSLAARQARSDLMSEAQAAELGASWSATWASWRLRSPHRRLVYGKQQVHAIAFAERDRKPTVLAAGADGHVRTWDLGTGQTVEPDRVEEAACLITDGALVLAGSSDEPAVRRWDLGSGDLDPFEQHRAPVRALAIERVDGVPIVASGDKAGLVHLWKAESGELITPAPSLGDAGVSALAMSGGVVVAALEDGSVHARGRQGWRRLELPGHDSGRVVHSLAARSLPGGETVLVTGGADHRVRAFRLAGGNQAADPVALWARRHADAVHAVTHGVVDGDLAVVVSGSDDGTVRVWDLESGAPVGVPYTAHGGWVRSVAVRRFSDGTKVVSGGADGAVHVWELTSSGPVRGPFAGHARAVRALAVRRREDADLLLSGSLDGTVRQWDPIDGSDRGEVEGTTSGDDWIGAVEAVEIGGRSVVVAAGQPGVRVYEEGTDPKILPGHDRWVGSLARVDLAGQPGVVAAGYDGVPRVWNLVTHEERARYGERGGTEGHTRPVYALAIAHGVADGGGPSVVSAGADPELHVWDAATGVAIRRLQRLDCTGAVRALAVQGSLVFSAGDDGVLIVHDLASASTEPVASEPARTPRVNALAAFALHDERLRLISAGDDGALRAWDVSADGAITYVDKVQAHRGAARSLLGMARGADHVVYSGGEGGRIGVWDPSLKALVGGGHEGWVRAVTVTRDDKDRPIAVSGGDDATIRIWDLGTGEATETLRAGRRGSIRSMAGGARGSGPVIVLGSTDNAVRILDLAARQLKPLIGHTDWVCAVGTTRVDGRDVVVSGSDDGSVRLWDLSTGDYLRTLRTGDIGSVRTLTVTAEGAGPTLVLGSRNRQVSTLPLALEGGVATPLGGELEHAVQSVAALWVDNGWVAFARDDRGALVARRVVDGEAFPPPPSSAGEVGVVRTKRPDETLYTGRPRVAVASGEVVTVSEWADGSWVVLATPDLGSDVLALDFDETGRRLLVGARRGVAVIDLAPATTAPQA